MNISTHAGKLAEPLELVNVPRLVYGLYADVPILRSPLNGSRLAPPGIGGPRSIRF